MAEWLKAHAWKACIRETVSWVRIPLPPPRTKLLIYLIFVSSRSCESLRTFRAFARLPQQRLFAQRRIRPRLEACAVCESRLRISVVRQSLAQKQNFR